MPTARPTGSFWLTLAVMVAGLLPRVWVVSLGNAALIQDEANIGLMALHVLAGNVPPYHYGQDYLGSFDAIIIAGLFKMFGATSISLRLGALAWYAVFQVLLFVFVRRHWDAHTARLTVLLLALPSAYLLPVTATVSSNFGLMWCLGLGIALLLPGLRLDATPAAIALRSAAIGALAAFGFWIHPMSVIFLAVFTVTVVLASGAWHKDAQRLPQAVGLAVVVAAVAAVAIAFFTEGCSGESWQTLRGIGKAYLLILALAGGGVVLRNTARKSGLLAGLAGGATGALLGAGPMIWAFATLQIVPGANVKVSCLSDVPDRLGLFLDQLLPSAAGLPQMSRMLDAARDTLGLPLLAAAVLLLAAAVFFRANWPTVTGLASLRPLAHGEQAAALMLGLFGLQCLLVVLGSNTQDITSLRYLAIAWVPLALFFAFGFRHAPRAPRWALAAALGLVLVQAGLANLLVSIPAANRRADLWADQTMRAMEQFLSGNRVTAGYADGYQAQVFSFLMGERVVFAPYSGADRYPPHTERAAKAPRQAFLVSRGAVPDGSRDIVALAGYLKATTRGEPTSIAALTGLAESTVVARQQFGSWDLWIIE